MTRGLIRIPVVLAAIASAPVAVAGQRTWELIPEPARGTSACPCASRRAPVPPATSSSDPPRPAGATVDSW